MKSFTFIVDMAGAQGQVTGTTGIYLMSLMAGAAGAG